MTETTNPPPALSPGGVSGEVGKKTGRRPAAGTVARWIMEGVRAADGTRVRLPAFRVGSRWFVRPADLEAFLERLGAIPAPEPAPDPRSRRDRATAARSAIDELERLGA